MKRADASGAKFAVILGEEELARNELSVKALRADDKAQSAQVSVPLNEAIQLMR